MRLAVLVERQVVERAPLRLAARDEGAHRLVRIAEGHAALGEVVGDVGREREVGDGGRASSFSVKLQCRQHRGVHAQGDEERVDGVEQRLLVLLVVLVVGQRLRLQERERLHEVAEHAAALAPHQLADIGVLLLRHDARPGRERIVEAREPELRRGPEDDFLGQSREVHHHERAGAMQIDDEVAV